MRAPVGLLPALVVGGSTDGRATLYRPSASGVIGSPVGTIALPGISGTNVRAATADVNGDGIPDTVLVSGPGTPIRVAVICGADNSTVLVAPRASRDRLIVHLFNDSNNTGGHALPVDDVPLREESLPIADIRIAFRPDYRVRSVTVQPLGRCWR